MLNSSFPLKILRSSAIFCKNILSRRNKLPVQYPWKVNSSSSLLPRVFSSKNKKQALEHLEHSNTCLANSLQQCCEEFAKQTFFSSCRMWLCGKQLPEKSRISRQLPKWYALRLFHSYPTRHGVEHIFSRFSLGGRWLGVQVNKHEVIHITQERQAFFMHCIFPNGYPPPETLRFFTGIVHFSDI